LIALLVISAMVELISMIQLKRIKQPFYQVILTYFNVQKVTIALLKQVFPNFVLQVPILMCLEEILANNVILESIVLPLDYKHLLLVLITWIVIRMVLLVQSIVLLVPIGLRLIKHVLHAPKVNGAGQHLIQMVVEVTVIKQVNGSVKEEPLVQDHMILTCNLFSLQLPISPLTMDQVIQVGQLIQQLGLNQSVLEEPTDQVTMDYNVKIAQLVDIVLMKEWALLMHTHVEMAIFAQVNLKLIVHRKTMVVQKQVMLQEDLFVQLVNTVHKVQLILKYVQMDNTV
jgi:hypothetical protein